MTPADDFLAFIRSVGLAPVKPVDLDDGRLVRWRGEGDKPGARNVWAVLHAHPSPWGVVGSWRTGEQHSWRARDRATLTEAERAEQRRQIAAARAARDAEQVAVQAAARAKADRLWQVARPATDAHAYLQRKRVHCYGLKQLGERLLVPARDVDGVLHTLQFIDGDGTKRFLTGGRIAGCYCPVGRLSDRLLICEGLATASTLHEATGAATAAAFSAGNLKPVALALRHKFPGLRLVICADDDTQTPGNPGRAAAIDAAQAAGALVAFPSFEALST